MYSVELAWFNRPPKQWCLDPIEVLRSARLGDGLGLHPCDGVAPWRLSSCVGKAPQRGDLDETTFLSRGIILGLERGDATHRRMSRDFRSLCKLP